MVKIGYATNQTGFPIEEIRDRIDLPAVAARLYPDLKRRGGKLMGSHGSVHSSKGQNCLTIYDQSWYCWHCQKGGDIFNLLGVHEFGEGYSGNGDQFLKVLELAAEEAGIDFEAVPEQDRSEAAERNKVFDIMTAATRWWHQQLMDEYPQIVEWLEKNYGFTEEFLDKKQIGFAPPKDKTKALLRHLKKLGYSDEECLASSVVNKGGFQRFYGRVIFPYWYNGQVKYLAARQTVLTPDEEHEKAKYQKLKIRDEDNQHISPHIKNSILMGLDTLRQARKLGRVVITEGAPDQLAAEQGGEPCLSPVTVRFKKQDVDNVADQVRGIERIYLCMDNEENQAGEHGAIETARDLEERGITCYIIRLPRPEGVEKIDVCDYIRLHGIKSFTALYQEALRLPHYLVAFSPAPDNLHGFIEMIANLSRKCRYDPLLLDSLQQEIALKLKIKPSLVNKIFKSSKPRGEPHPIETPGLEVEHIEKIKSSPPRYELYVKGCDVKISMNIEELLDFTSFRNKLAATTNLVITSPIPPEKGVSKADTWALVVGELLKKVIEIDAPDDASETYLIEQKILEFLTSPQNQSDKKEDILGLGRVWIDEKNVHFFRGSGVLHNFLKAYIENLPDVSQLYAIFRDMGGENRVIKIGKKPVRCWGLKVEEEIIEAE